VRRLTLVGLIAVGLLWATPRLASGAVTLAHDDQVHYAGHLVAGRILSLWPATARLAEVQYSRGMYHARTPREVALLTSERPTSIRGRIGEAPALASSALRRISSRLLA
jgi:hypothetical protein